MISLEQFPRSGVPEGTWTLSMPMVMILRIACFVLVLFQFGPSPSYAQGGLPAFPGAVGFGAFATGGRGGSVYHVTNLNDSGLGSFRDAVSGGHRIVVFDVGGNIRLGSAVSVHSDLTIAGQTAPGDGIAVEGREVSFSNSHNVIVRYIRFRQGAADPDTGKSTIGMDSASNIILDHVSIEFGSWDNIDMNGSTNITIQNTILADPIGQQFNAHCQSDNITWAYNLWSSAHNRNPLAKGNTQFVNNVVYNFQAGYTAGNTSGHFSHDVLNNYFITGPSTTSPGDAFYQMTNQSVYFTGNFEDSNRDGRLNGSAMGYPGSTTHLSAPWSPTTSSLPTLSAAEAYAYVVASAGDSLRRDEVDLHVVGDVTSLGRSGRLWAAQDQIRLFSNNGYPLLTGGTAPLDTDRDGMPDAWERQYGLDPNSASDANGDFDHTGYTNIEKYINGLVDGSYPIDTVSGRITLQGCVNPAQSITFTFRPTDGSAGFTLTQTLAADGSFQLEGIPTKSYVVAIKGAKWLRRVVPVDATAGSVSGVTATLLAGDANNDNAVTTADYLLLKASFGSQPGDPNWNDGAADFNCDGIVSTADYLLLKQNFGLQGDP